MVNEKLKREFDKHIQPVHALGTPYRIFEAKDEIWLSKSSVWNETGSRQVRNHLSDKVNEPEELIVYTKALMRVTVNLEAEQLSQGQVGVVQDVPTGDSVTIYVPDSSGCEIDITPEMLEQENYVTWRTVKSKPVSFNLSKRTLCEGYSFRS